MQHRKKTNGNKKLIGGTYPNSSICQADLEQWSCSTVLELETNLKAYGWEY